MLPFMLLSVLIFILTNIGYTKIIRPPMKLFEAPHNLYLNGHPERRKHLVEQESTSKILMTNIASAAVPLPLNFTIEMVITPFQELFIEKEQKVFTAKMTMIDNASVSLSCFYEKGNKLRLVSVFSTNKLLKEDTKQLIQVVQPFGWNKLKFSFNYQNHTVPIGSIKTIVQFQQSKPIFKGIMTNFSIMIHTEFSLLPIVFGKQPTEWIGTVDPISHPISLTGLVLPENLQSKKPPHSIPMLGKGRKLLVCHDMMNGYKEDVNQYSNKFGKNAYRFHHWKITDIFVYFSHQNIAIPPKHYRMICKREKVVCLATFIIEGPLDWLKFEMADFLIFLAREYEFDGYLINIEYKVSKPDLFKDWLTYLTNSIHSQLPNSIIVLYDAIINDGSLRYQSGLSEQNIDFMSTVDYFFSDYHWNLTSLQNTVALSQSLQRGTDVFMGNDVFGRGTWGGGMFNTDVAVREINKYNLSTAIFAPGFVYQNCGGNRNYSRFEQLDDKLWFGKSFNQKQVKFPEWAYLSKGWKQEGSEAVTSAVNCIRSKTFALANDNIFDSIVFSVYIKGTPPDVRDPYTIVLQLLDENENPFKFVSTGNGYQYATQQFEQVKLKIQINSEERQRAKMVKVIETGRDIENWGGHYGTRFKEQTFYFNFFKEEKSISNFYYERPEMLPYQSFYNVAVGPNYFFEGKKIINDTGYTFLADYDMPYQNKKLFREDSFDENYSSHHLDVSYDQSKGWVGAGNLRISSSQGKFALRLAKLEQKLENISVRFVLQTNKKQLPVVGLKFNDKSTKIIECIAKQANNSWIQLSAQEKLDPSKELESVYLVYDSKQSDIVINIGQISLFTSESLSLQKYNPQIVAVRCSISSLDCIDLYINLKQFPQSLKSVFIEIDGKVIGTLYEKTGYFEEIKGDSRNVTVKLLGLSHTGRISPIYQQQISGELV